ALLAGSEAQRACSGAPPPATTNGELAGHHAVGPGNAPVSLCCLLMPRLPKSPVAAKKLSCLARPAWNTWSNRAVWTAAAPPKACSVAASDKENTVPGGVASISPEIALNRFGKPCTPRVSAGGTASSTMCASGAIEYAHSMSSVASPDHKAAAHGPDRPLLLQVLLNCGLPCGKICSKLGAGKLGKNVSWKCRRSAAAVGLPYASTSTIVWPWPIDGTASTPKAALICCGV